MTKPVTVSEIGLGTGLKAEETPVKNGPGKYIKESSNAQGDVTKDKKLGDTENSFAGKDKAKGGKDGAAGGAKGGKAGAKPDAKEGKGGKPVVNENASGFQQEGLAIHNVFRKVHGSPEMKLDEGMSKEAEAYAQLIAKEGKLFHSSTKDGENLAMGCNKRSKKVSAAEAVKDW